MLTLLAATAALGAPTALPRYDPGDAFVFSDGRVERVVADDGDRMVWAGLTGPTYARSRNFVVPVLQWRNGRGTGTRAVRGNPDALWPIDRSKSARFRIITETQATPQSPRKRSVSLWVCKTGKTKMLTVPAGTYSTLPVVCDRYSPTSMRLLERREWSYAPELGHYVRRASINYLRGTNSSVELVAALSGPSATKARLTALSRNARRERLTQAKAPAVPK